MISGTGHALERTILFSDAVFAIAITLLVIEIHPPHLEHGATTADAVQQLLNMWPQFLGYALSFFVIGLFWIGHHRAFGLASHYSPRVAWPNLQMLGVIAFMPFTTAYMSANGTARVPVVVYAGWQVVAGIVNLRVNSIATSPPMLREGVTAEEVRLVRQRGIAVILGAVTTVIATIFAPIAPMGLMGMGTIPLWRLLLTRLGGKSETVEEAEAEAA